MVSKQSGATDFLQFPRETLRYTTGDCDDLSILYCSVMQSLNIDTALITVPGHIYVAVSPAHGAEIQFHRSLGARCQPMARGGPPGRRDLLPAAFGVGGVQARRDPRGAARAHHALGGALRFREYVPAMINKGNLMFLEGSSREAQAVYQRVLVLQTEAPGALLGLARCYHALRNYSRVSEPFERVKNLLESGYPPP